MKILITNDDGIKAPGIRLLAQIASQYGEVYVVAPHVNNSAVGHGITMRRPLKEYSYPLEETVLSIGIDGTPADCIKYALAHLKIKPDIVLSGVNDESNVGTDIIYSGTVSGAIEANLCGYPAIAVSTCGANFEVVQTYLSDILQKLIKSPLAADTTININFPNVEQPLGIKVASVGVSRYDEVYVADGNGHRLSGPFIDIEQSSETDVKSLMGGFITVTPVKLTLYDCNKMQELQELLTK